jgi:hypothetical protein
VTVGGDEWAFSRRSLHVDLSALYAGGARADVRPEDARRDERGRDLQTWATEGHGGSPWRRWLSSRGGKGQCQTSFES